jgi:hypothetical protein
LNRRRVEQFALGLIAVFMLPAGLQAALTPRSFFDDFPLGRGWIEQEGGAYNEHLVRDVGALFLALIIVTVWTLWRHPLARPVAAAWLVQGTLHLAYHAGHLDGYNTTDRLGLISSLVTVPLLALVALWAGWSSPKEPSR